MATEGMPPVPPSAGELGGEAALQPTRAALGVLAQLAQGQGTGRQADKLLQFLRDRGTPALARGLLYDALLAAGLSDEGGTWDGGVRQDGGGMLWTLVGGTEPLGTLLCVDRIGSQSLPAQSLACLLIPLSSSRHSNVSIRLSPPTP